MGVVIFLIVICVIIAFVVNYPFIGVPVIVILVALAIIKRKSIKAWYDSLPDNEKQEKKTDNNIDTVSISSKISLKSDYSDYSRFFQKWDKNYNKDLGYEWFRVCVEIVKFPIYNSIDSRLTNVRKKIGITQADAARMANISVSTLSSYENGYTLPSSSSLISLANVYSVPLEFLKSGFVKYLSEHIELCLRFGEDEYIHSLSLAVTAASRLFPEILTQEDKGIVILVNDILNLKLDLFNEKAIAKENLQNEIRSEIMVKLNEGEVNQRELYAYYEENRYIAQKIVKELFDNGVIKKEKSGSTYLLKLSKTENNNDKGVNNE